MPISCLHAACSVCKVETGMKPDTRTVKTQYPSRYSEHTSLWTPEELSVLRRRHDQAVSEKNRQTNRADLLERELKDAETANKNLESEVSLLSKVSNSCVSFKLIDFVEVLINIEPYQICI